MTIEMINAQLTAAIDAKNANMPITVTMGELNALVAAEVAKALGAKATAPTAVVSAPAAPKTLAAAKADSWSERIHRGCQKVTEVSLNGAGVVGTFTADVASTVEVKAGPAIVSGTGYVCAKSASAASATGTKLSAWADRLAAMRVAMEFAK